MPMTDPATLRGTLTFQQPEGDREVLLGGDPDGTDLFIWLHGGSSGSDAGRKMANRVTSVRGRMDLFPTALLGADGDAHWIHPAAWEHAPAGFWDPHTVNVSTDFDLMAAIVSSFPTKRVFLVGYSGGGGFLQGMFHTTVFGGVAGWGVVKNTPIDSYVKSGPRGLTFDGVAPPKMVYWFAQGDPLAEQAPPHLTDLAARDVWRATYGTTPVTPQRRVWNGNPVDWYAEGNLTLAIEPSGSHYWLKNIDEWVAEALRA